MAHGSFAGFTAAGFTATMRRIMGNRTAGTGPAGHGVPLASALLLLVAVSMTIAPTQARAQDDPGFLRVGAGYYDIDDDQDAGEFHVEYISGQKLWVFNPFIGIMGTTDAAVYGYGGVRLDIFLGRRFVLTPAFAAGLYSDGDGKDLGHTVEFRSALELAYRFDDRSRLGISLYHLSNASLDDNNPGTEVVTVHYSYPLTRIFD